MARTNNQGRETINEQPVDEVRNNEVEATNAAQPSNRQEIIKQLIVNGAKKITDKVIKNITITHMEDEGKDYTRVSFTLNSTIAGFIRNDDDEYVDGSTNIIYTSLYAIVGAMREDENLSWMGNYVLKNPNMLSVILSGATIDILQQHVSAGEAYKNPFTTRQDSEEQFFDHDIYINNIIKFKLSKVGAKAADRLMDKLLDVEL